MDDLYSLLELIGMLATDPRIAVLFALLAFAAIHDWRTFRIPNWLTMGGAAFALIYSVFFPFSFQGGFLSALGGLALGLVLMFPLYAIKVMGAGDVKLMAMVGSYLGIHDVFFAVVASFVVGGVVALAYALSRGLLRRLLANVKHLAQTMALSAWAGVGVSDQMKIDGSVGKIPYGVSICVGTIAYVLGTHLGFL